MNISKKLIRLFIGLILYAFAIVFMLNADIGLASWDVLNQGLSLRTGITIGQCSIIIGSIIVIIDASLNEDIGWGTILNMIFIGVFIDVIINAKLIPISHNIVQGIIMTLIGNIIVPFATVLYIGAGLGSGPRDGLMIAIYKKTNKPIGIVRTTLEGGALLSGWILGGKVGLGTIISVCCIGYIMEFVFKICKFDTKDVRHRFIKDDILYLKNTILQRKAETSITKDDVEEETSSKDI